MTLDIVNRIATVEARPPRQVDDRIPKELERICLKALSKASSDRYTTAHDMAEDLALRGSQIFGGQRNQVVGRRVSLSFCNHSN